jgi:hypothetical protein
MKQWSQCGSLQRDNEELGNNCACGSCYLALAGETCKWRDTMLGDRHQAIAGGRQ